MPSGDFAIIVDANTHDAALKAADKKFQQVLTQMNIDRSIKKKNNNAAWWARARIL